MIPLVLDEPKILELKRFAEAHPIDRAQFEKIIQGKLPIAGDRAGHDLNLPVNFRVVYSVEELPLLDGSGYGWVRHMSVSLAVPGRQPSRIAVDQICKLLGFPDLSHCQISDEGGIVEVIASIPEEEATRITGKEIA